MLKKIPQKLLLLPLFFSLLLFSGSALAVCDLGADGNVIIKNLSRDGVDALSPAARAIVAAEAIAASCANGDEFTFADDGYRCVDGAGDSVWLDRNLGAHRICTARDDGECFGDYYQWGRNKDGHQRLNSDIDFFGRRIAYTTTDNANFIDSFGDWALGDDDGALRQARWAMLDGSGVCPIGFRVPNASELQAAIAELSPPLSGDGRDGSRYNSGVGHTGSLWSSDIYNNDNSESLVSIFVMDQFSHHNNSNRVRGYPVRCIQGALPAPAAPSTITATAYGTNIITVEWSAIDFYVDFYEIYRATSAATAAASIIISPSFNAPTAHTDTNLNAGTKYYYWVKACNTVGCSDFSASVSATTEDSAVDIAIACAENKAFAFAGNGYRCVAGNGDTVWLDRNLGAHRVCTASTDTSCFGDRYEWGRNKDGHQRFNSDSSTPTIAYTTTDNANRAGTNNLAGGDWASGDDNGLERQKRWAATDGSSICPRGFRVPSASELQAAVVELSPPLIFGNFGFLWSNDIDDNDNSKSLLTAFNLSGFIVHNRFIRAADFPVRCIQD